MSISMACNSCPSTMPSVAALPTFSPRRQPQIAPVVALPRLRQATRSSPVHLFGQSSGGFAARGRNFRAMAVLKKYKGTRMKEMRLAQLIEQKVLEAKEACAGDEAVSDECKVAWDEVEELSKAKANLRRRIAESGRDPLHSFCQENPETDECSVVDDD